MYVAMYTYTQKADLALWVFCKEIRYMHMCAFACAPCIVVMAPQFPLCFAWVQWESSILKDEKHLKLGGGFG